MSDAYKTGGVEKAARSRRWLSWVGIGFAWIYAAVAGGGGAVLLLTKGPWPLTNGWFALASGVSACPLTAWILKRTAGIVISWRLQLGLALFFFVAGRIALLAGI